jgi:hypothetical protein
MTGCGLHVLDALISLAWRIRQVDAHAFGPKPAPFANCERCSL